MSLNDIKNCTQIITIDGLDYTLQFDYTAYALAEELTQKSVFEIRDLFLDAKLKLKDQLILLFCGILRHHPDFDINKLKNYNHIGHALAVSLKPLADAFFTPLLPPDFSKNLEKTG